MAHVKLALKDELLATDLPDQEVFAARLPRYFPSNAARTIRSATSARISCAARSSPPCWSTTSSTPPASRYAYRVAEDVGVGPVDAVRTYVATDAIFRRRRGVAADPCRRRQRRVGGRVRPDDAGPAAADRPRRTLAAQLPSAAAGGRRRDQPVRREGRGADAAHVGVAARRRQGHRRKGSRASSSRRACPRTWPTWWPPGLYQYSLLDIIDIADIVDRDPAEVADTYFALMDHLGTDGLLTAVSELPRDDRWHSLARLAIRDDIYGSLRSLCFDVLAVGEPDESGEEKIAEWEHDQQLPGGRGPAAR